MSAIYGTVSLRDSIHDTIDKNLIPFNTYNFDHIEQLRFNDVSFACFHQELTLEAKNEVLPYLDSDTGCIITADAILDNRDELIKLLNIESNNITDSQLILKAYYKWGNESPKYLIGSFAYSIYNKEIDELVVVRDQIGSRMLYYKLTHDEFAFSTLLKPLNIETKKLNSSYIKNFLSVNNVMHDFDPEETIYYKTLILSPGHMIVYKNGNIQKKCYWKLNKNTKKKWTYSEANKEFKKIFDEAIICRLRSSSEVGINLSSGYDSSAIACVAAKCLKDNNKVLHSFTSVASKEFDLNMSSKKSGDESDIVKDIKIMYPNILLNITDSPNLTPINTLDEIMETLEQPFKFNANGYWVNNFFGLASQKDCKVLLTGQMGNSTFSYSDLDKYYYHLIKSFRLKKFYNEYTRNCKFFKVSRKNSFKELIRKIFESNIFDENQDFVKYNNLDKNEKKKLKETLVKLNASYHIKSPINDVMQYAIDPLTMNHVAAVETKLGLKHNIIMRDPTRDVRLVEFLNELSIENFNYNGFTRTLATSYMDSVVPNSVIFSELKGIQGADFLYRINKEWPDFIKKFKIELQESDIINEYIDVEQLKLDLNEFETLKCEYNPDYIMAVVNLLIVSSCIKFIKSF